MKDGDASMIIDCSDGDMMARVSRGQLFIKLFPSSGPAVLK